MPIEMPPGTRKYQTEFTLVIAVEGAYLLRAQDLDQVPTTVLDGNPQCHLYVISRAPRLSIDPASVRIEAETLSGEVTIHRRGEAEAHPFASRHQLGKSGLQWQSDWPHETYAIVDDDGQQVHGGVCALLGAISETWPEQAYEHEILYVGQAYGTGGERTAWDRIKKHETLQRILADQLPDTQVWLTMAAVIDVQVVQEISPTGGTVSDDEDTAHAVSVLQQVNREGFSEREAVALAEAGLIRGWQPEYNDRLKHNFPARKQISMDRVRGLDIHGLVVEWQSLQLPPRYRTELDGPSKIFFFGYRVHLDPDRAQTLSLAALERPLLAETLGRMGMTAKNEVSDPTSTEKPALPEE